MAGVPGRRGASVQIQLSGAGVDLRAGAGGDGVRGEGGVVYADEAEPASGRAGHRAAGPAQPFRASQIDLQQHGGIVYDDAVSAIRYAAGPGPDAVRRMGVHVRGSDHVGGTEAGGLYFNRTKKLTVLN